MNVNGISVTDVDAWLARMAYWENQGKYMRLPPLSPHTLLLTAALLVTACDREEASADGQNGSERPIAVTTTILQLQSWTDTIVAIGTAKAHESVTMSAKVSETVQGVHFNSGDRVTKGEALITLSGQQQQASLNEAQAAASEADRLYRRQDELASQQLIARASLDTQRATRDAARARVAQVRAEIADRTIRAPFAGVLGIRQLSPGALVTPGTVIATLDDLSRIYVDFPVPEARLADLEIGQRLTARSTSYPGRAFAGTVSTIESRIDPATRAVAVRGDFPNPESTLRPGMLLEVRLERAQRQALVIPEIAVVQVGRDTFAYRVKADQSVEQAKIELGARSYGKAEVVSGLKAGDKIVVDGTGKLRPGIKIDDGNTANAPAAKPDIQLRRQ